MYLIKPPSREKGVSLVDAQSICPAPLPTTWGKGAGEHRYPAGITLRAEIATLLSPKTEKCKCDSFSFNLKTLNSVSESECTGDWRECSGNFLARFLWDLQDQCDDLFTPRELHYTQIIALHVGNQFKQITVCKCKRNFREVNLKIIEKRV